MVAHKILETIVLGLLWDSDFGLRLVNYAWQYVIFFFLMVADGKWVGPQSKYVKDLKELGKHPNDNSVLPRGSKFLDRMFIKVKKERQSFANLLKGDLYIP